MVSFEMFSVYYFILVVLIFTSSSYKNVNCRHLSESLKLYLESNENDEYFDKADSDQPAISDEELPKNGELFEGDMVMDENIRRAVIGESSKKSVVLGARMHGAKHWEDGIVPYDFDRESLSSAPEIMRQIKNAIAEFKLLTCIRFVPRKPWHRSWVRFQSKKGGCSSAVGKQGGMQHVQLGSGCKRIGTVIHEMMHAIGFIHEQSRPDRGLYLDVKYDNIKQKLLHNFRKYSWHEADNQDIPYNYWSVMHYSNYAFSDNGRKTLVAKVDEDLKFGQRKQLTPLDVKQINRLYRCPHPVVRKEDFNLMHDMTPSIAVSLKKRDSLLRYF